MVYNIRIGNTDLLDGPPPWESRDQNEEYGSDYSTHQDDPACKWTDKGGDAREYWLAQSSSLCAVAVEVGQEILIDEFRLKFRPFLTLTAKENTTEHAISVEPVGIPAQVLVRQRVAAITNVLAASEVGWNCSLVRARC